MRSVRPGRHSLATLTTAIAALVAVVVALVPASAYFWATYEATRGALAAEAQITARLVAQIVNQNPEHWRLQETHLDSLLTMQSAEKVPELRRIVDERGQVVAHSGNAIGSWLTSYRAPIHDSGVVVAQLEISRSLQPMLWTSAAIALVSLGFALLGFWGLRVLPLRALQRALDQAGKSKDRAFNAVRDREKAEAAALMRSMFLANMSHELRTPMNGVLGMLEVTLDTPLSAEQREHLALAHQSARHLLTILNDILDFSKIDAGMLRVSAVDFDLTQLLDSVMRASRHRAHDKGIKLEQQVDSSLPSRVCADPDRLRQILINLMGNAIKFTRAGRVSLCANLEHEGSALYVHLQVQDTGIGIAPAQLEHVFSAFSQADSTTTREFGGTGLGLTISRQLTELMGGRLWATSELGQGSVFHARVPVTLPQHQEEQAGLPEGTGAAMASTEAAPARRMRHILVTDDNEINRRLAGILLTRQGHQVSYANDGKQALEAATADIDLILMDVEMPVMGGFEATRLLRERGCVLPIIALTAHAIEGYREKCIDAGMNEFITKPISAKALVTLVDHFLPQPQQPLADSATA
jgi:signal transduction histidine kinase/CheY-like chemotaxis protein